MQKNIRTLIVPFLALLVLSLTFASVSAATPQADMYVASITATPVAIMPDHITTQVAVKCTTGFTANSNKPTVVTTDMYNGDQVINTVSRTFQGTNTVSDQVTLELAPGNYNIACKVSGNAKGDNPSNNYKTYSLVVASPPPVIASISVAPPSPSVEVGKTQNFVATALDQYKKPYSLAGQNILWKVVGTPGTMPIGTITPNGVFTGQLVGSGYVTVTVGDISGSATVTVTAPPPPPPVINVGIDFVTICCSSAPWPISPPGIQAVYARDPAGISTAIRNKGSQTINAIPVIVKLNGIKIMELATGSIPPGGVFYLKEMSNYVFDRIGYNEITVEAIMPGDVDPSDNMVVIGVDVLNPMLPDPTVGQSSVFSGGASSPGGNNISFQSYVGNVGTVPANNVLFEVITSAGKVIYSERLSLNAGERRLVTRVTNEPYPVNGMLGIKIVVNGDHALQELDPGNNMNYVTIYPIVPGIGS